MVDFQTLSCNSSLIWWLIILSLPLHAYYSNLHMVMSQGIQLTPDNSNPRELEPRANSKSFLFRFRSFLCKFTLDNWNHVVIEPWQCFVFFVLPVQIPCPFLYTWSLNCIPPPPPHPHPFAYFVISGYLLQTPDNSNTFRFP